MEKNTRRQTKKYGKMASRTGSKHWSNTKNIFTNLYVKGLRV